MNSVSRFLSIAAMFALLAVSPVSSNAADAVNEIEGEWRAAPELSQLGEVQVSYVFRADGSFLQTVDFLSFCGRGAVQPDCEYFRTTSNGQYSGQGESLTLRHVKAESLLKYPEMSDPITRDMGMKAVSEKMTFKLEEGKLLLTNRNGKVLVLLPFPSPQQ